MIKTIIKEPIVAIATTMMILIFVMAVIYIASESNTLYNIDCQDIHLRNVKAYINQYGVIYTNDGQVITGQCVATEVRQ